MVAVVVHEGVVVGKQRPPLKDPSVLFPDLARIPKLELWKNPILHFVPLFLNTINLYCTLAWVNISIS